MSSRSRPAITVRVARKRADSSWPRRTAAPCSREFSMAMAACAAKALSRSICSAVNWRRSQPYTFKTPMARSRYCSGTPRYETTPCSIAPCLCSGSSTASSRRSETETGPFFRRTSPLRLSLAWMACLRMTCLALPQVPPTTSLSPTSSRKPAPSMPSRLAASSASSVSAILALVRLNAFSRSVFSTASP